MEDPSFLQELPEKLKKRIPFYSIKLEEGNKLLYHGESLIIPDAIQQHILAWTHTMYQHPEETRFIQILAHNLD